MEVKKDREGGYNSLMEEKEQPEEKEDKVVDIVICPECGSPSLIPAGHCLTCLSCGWSLCSL
jgi:hypothetical protein